MQTFLLFSFIAWIVFIGLGPKRDRRYKTGYKNNDTPISGWFKIKVSFFFWLIVILIYWIFGPSSEIKAKQNVSVYMKPNNKSKIIDVINDSVAVKKLRETKYFFEIEYKNTNGEIVKGFAIKDSLK